MGKRYLAVLDWNHNRQERLVNSIKHMRILAPNMGLKDAKELTERLRDRGAIRVQLEQDALLEHVKMMSVQKFDGSMYHIDNLELHNITEVSVDKDIVELR